MRLWRLAVASSSHRHSPCPVPILPLAHLSFAVYCLSRIPQFPMGHFAFRNWFSVDLFRPAKSIPTPVSHCCSFANGSLDPALALILPHVSIRLCQTAQRRSKLAQPHYAYFSLRNPAVTDVDWVVRASTP